MGYPARGAGELQFRPEKTYLGKGIYRGLLCLCPYLGGKESLLILCLLKVLNQLGILLERVFVFLSFDLCLAGSVRRLRRVTLLPA